MSVREKRAARFDQSCADRSLGDPFGGRAERVFAGSRLLTESETERLESFCRPGYRNNMSPNSDSARNARHKKK